MNARTRFSILLASLLLLPAMIVAVPDQAPSDGLEYQMAFHPLDSCTETSEDPYYRLYEPEKNMQTLDILFVGTRNGEHFWRVTPSETDIPGLNDFWWADPDRLTDPDRTYHGMPFGKNESFELVSSDEAFKVRTLTDIPGIYTGGGLPTLDRTPPEHVLNTETTAIHLQNRRQYTLTRETHGVTDNVTERTDIYFDRETGIFMFGKKVITYDNFPDYVCNVTIYRRIDRGEERGDSLKGWFEYLFIGSDNKDPDSDNDGIPDGEEVRKQYDPTSADTDGEGLNDSLEEELGTNVTDPDTDSDGVNDYREQQLNTDPLEPDTDGDNLTDGEEVELGTDPLSIDTDGDDIPDGEEVAEGTDPLTAQKKPLWMQREVQLAGAGTLAGIILLLIAIKFL